MSSSKPRVIVVTGVSRGLGRAMVDGLIQLGHTVIGCARSGDAVGQLSDQYERPHSFSVVDIQSDSEVASWATGAIERHGPPDLLINNAALINKNRVLWEVSAEEFGRVVDVNVKGTFYVIRHFLPAMLEAEQGIVANFSSGWGRATSPEVAPYCATKWAIEGLTKSLAQELPNTMAAVAVNPGIINTDMLKSCFGGSSASYPSAQEWAERAVPFLLGLTRANNGDAASV